MNNILSYLVCGCTILQDGSRVWCPSCSSLAVLPATEDQVAALKNQLRLAQDLLFEIYDAGLELRHDEDCSGDDTCECTVMARLKEALKGMN